MRRLSSRHPDAPGAYVLASVAVDGDLRNGEVLGLSSSLKRYVTI